MQDNTHIKWQNGSISVPDIPTIPFIEGDGSGRDIWRATKNVIDSAIAKSYRKTRKIQWLEILAGEKAFKQTGDWLPQATLSTFREHLVGIKGPLNTPVGGGIRSLNVALRKELDLYVCMRPVRWYQGIPAPVLRPDLLNVVIFRENTEDVYSGIEFQAYSDEVQSLISFIKNNFPSLHEKIRFPASTAITIKPISEEGSSRLVRAAIQFALENKRKRVTLVHKGNIMKFTEGGFCNWGYKVASTEFSDRVITQTYIDQLRAEKGESTALAYLQNSLASGKILINDVIADAAFEIALTRPQELDVIATTNLNGDYLSDALAAQVGGLGIAPGVNLNLESGAAIFEATHGTAPSLADKDLVNPCSLILSGVLMLRYLGWEDPANLIESALEKTIASKKVTQDFARLLPGVMPLSTSQFAAAIIEFMEK